MNKLFDQRVYQKFEVLDYRHASTILKNDFPKEFDELNTHLSEFELLHSEILTPGGRKSPVAQNFDNALYSNGWEEKSWDVNIEVDGHEHPSPTHQVDYYRNRVAIELEWNNKDPFYDRDLNNFRLLHELNIISVGVIVTRSTQLQEVFNELGRGKSYGSSTTHVSKLLPKVEGGGSAECPLIIFAIKPEACVDDVRNNLQ